MGSVPSLQTRVEGRSAGFTAQPAEAQLSRVPLPLSVPCTDHRQKRSPAEARLAYLGAEPLP